ncbi:hypothetical protein HYH03_008687 [Edaphochlamys debaryana]|uniref:Uncharacterized protein n=1 Tax=Edaphochlamys debaryana TaxID=47281 RepID=A0A835Y8K5_9CHLO|nr:hypothetical protein HYH03_008687 [Edaphochlamys debaryana]|eukprot:KAG2493024.1 hypothetical protein HYH03_008687 [Edaphochlamys debaryana]
MRHHNSAATIRGRGVMNKVLALAILALPPRPVRPPPQNPDDYDLSPPVLDADGCGWLVESYSIRPGMSWGEANPAVQEYYTASNCDVKICVYWKKKYSVVPFVTYGSLSADLQKLWDHPRSDANGQTCNELSGPLSSTECGAVQERYGILPLVSPGSATPNVVALFSSSGCDTSICTVWRQRYGVTPYVTRVESGRAAFADLGVAGGLLDSSECGALVEIYGIVPGSSWGSAGANVQGLYTASLCDTRVCTYWRTKYSVVPFLKWGSLPRTLQNSWEFVRQPSGKTCNELSGPLVASDCEALQQAFGIVLFSSWGTAPEKVQGMWASSDCDQLRCMAGDPNCQMILG